MDEVQIGVEKGDNRGQDGHPTCFSASAWHRHRKLLWQAGDCAQLRSSQGDRSAGFSHSPAALL